MTSSLLLACGGFLLAVLWFDLMFDVQAFGAPGGEAIGSIMAYYRRVTTDAAPMTYLVAIVMATTLAAGFLDVRRATDARVLRAVSFLLAAVPITLALVRVFPNAMTLGGAAEAGPEEAALARTILGDHLFCLASILGFLAARLAIARAPRE